MVSTGTLLCLSAYVFTGWNSREKSPKCSLYVKICQKKPNAIHGDIQGRDRADVTCMYSIIFFYSWYWFYMSCSAQKAAPVLISYAFMLNYVVSEAINLRKHVQILVRHVVIACVLVALVVASILPCWDTWATHSKCIYPPAQVRNSHVCENRNAGIAFILLDMASRYESIIVMIGTLCLTLCWQLQSWWKYVRFCLVGRRKGPNFGQENICR